MGERGNNGTWLRELAEYAERGAPVTRELALAVLRSEPGEFPAVCAVTTSVRRRFFADRIHLCSLCNAKSGA